VAYYAPQLGAYRSMVATAIGDEIGKPVLVFARQGLPAERALPS
jgi:hypothetical protein